MGKGSCVEVSKPLSPFFQYRAEVYPQLRKEYPDVRVTKIAKMIGQMWDALDQGKKDKYD